MQTMPRTPFRKHWRIENKLHYTRDVTLCEDASRIRKNPGVFARMRSFAYNILRINQSDTIAQDRYAAALGGLKSIFSMRFSKEPRTALPIQSQTDKLLLNSLSVSERRHSARAITTLTAFAGRIVGP